MCDTAERMDAKFTLPAELVEGASIQGNEYGWSLNSFPDAARRAESLGYACLGGQFQFRVSVGTCEMYWLSADSTERQAEEDWPAYCVRSRVEVLDRFQQIVAGTDFLQEALQWPVLKSEMERGFDVIPTLVFVAYFVTEVEWLSDKRRQIRLPPDRASKLPNCLNAKPRRSARCYKKLNSAGADSENNLGGSLQTICITSDLICTRRRSAIA